MQSTRLMIWKMFPPPLISRKKALMRSFESFGRFRHVSWPLRTCSVIRGRTALWPDSNGVEIARLALSKP